MKKVRLTPLACFAARERSTGYESDLYFRLSQYPVVKVLAAGPVQAPVFRRAASPPFAQESNLLSRGLAVKPLFEKSPLSRPRPGSARRSPTWSRPSQVRSLVRRLSHNTPHRGDCKGVSGKTPRQSGSSPRNARWMACFAMWRICELQVWRTSLQL